MCVLPRPERRVVNYKFVPGEICRGNRDEIVCTDYTMYPIEDRLIVQFEFVEELYNQYMIYTYVVENLIDFQRHKDFKIKEFLAAEEEQMFGAGVIDTPPVWLNIADRKIAFKIESISVNNVPYF